MSKKRHKKSTHKYVSFNHESNESDEYCLGLCRFVSFMQFVVGKVV
jgi:hypothetical protein